MSHTAGNSWTVIINSTTCRHRSKEWLEWLSDQQINYQFYQTTSLSELHSVLEATYMNGNRRYLFVGGDGTMHQGVNCLMQISKEGAKELIVSLLPCGTGNDWVRSFGRKKEMLASALKSSDKKPMHLIKVQWPDGRVRYAVNMLGGGLDASVVKGLRNFPWKWPALILYPLGLVMALLKSHHWNVRIRTNESGYDEKLLTLQAGFGQYCGGGMYVLPFANGDVPAALLMIKQKSLLSILLSTPKIYNGKILRQKQAIGAHFMNMEITHTDKPFPVEADGEFLGYSPCTLTVMINPIWRI